MRHVSTRRKRTQPTVKRGQPREFRPTTRRHRATSRKPALSPGALAARRKFLRAFPGGFQDETYLDWERNYKWSAHKAWAGALDEDRFRAHLKDGGYTEIAAEAIRIESRTNLLFSFEKMALRDAVRSSQTAKAFSLALYDMLHGAGGLEERFDNWIASLDKLPRRQTRVLTWPLATVFGFIAQPRI